MLIEGVANADLVLLVTTRPTTGNTLAWAVACERDQWGRAIAGNCFLFFSHIDIYVRVCVCVTVTVTVCCYVLSWIVHKVVTFPSIHIILCLCQCDCHYHCHCHLSLSMLLCLDLDST